MAWFRYERIPAEDVKAGDDIALMRTANFSEVVTVDLRDRVASFTFGGPRTISLLRDRRVWRMVAETSTHAYDLECPRCSAAPDSHCVDPEDGTMALKGTHRQRVEAAMRIAKTHLTGRGTESV